MQAALGRYQLRQLDDWVAQRRQNVAVFNEVLNGTDGIRLTVPDNQSFHACYKYYFFIEPERLKSDWNRDRVVAEIHAGGAPCFTGTCPEIYREEGFINLYGHQTPLPVAKELGETSVMMNVHPGITPALVTDCAEVVRGVMKQAVR